MESPYRRSTLALAVLSMLREAERSGDATLHPYRMQRLIRERGKDEVVNVGQRASLYRTIDRLDRAGLIQAVGSSRQDKRPERTMYGLTDEGRRAFHEWMLDVLATPNRGYPEFPAAIAFIPLLQPEEVLGQLETRREKLATELARITAVISESARWGRIFTLEMEYLRATTEAELSWVQAIVTDLRAGEIAWESEDQDDPGAASGTDSAGDAEHHRSGSRPVMAQGDQQSAAEAGSSRTA